MYGYLIASVVTMGKSAVEIETETLRVMNANGSLGRRFLRWDDGPDCRRLYFELVS